MVLGFQVLPNYRPAEQKAFDWIGMILVALMLASLAWALNQLDARDFFGSLLSWNVLPFLAAFFVLLVILTQVEQRARNPILPPQLFDRKQLTLAYGISAGAGLAEASLVFMPLLAVVSLHNAGITEKSASWMLMPVVLAMVVGSPTAGRLLDRFGSRAVILSGTSVMTAGMFLLGAFASSLPVFIVSGVLIGLGMSALLGAPLRYIMLNEARASERSVAQGVVAVFTSAGQLLGSAMVGSIAASWVQTGKAAIGYSLAFLVVGVLSVVLVALSALLKTRAEEQKTVEKKQLEQVEGREILT
jgi:predicted MFS family arabinose efflux permease